MNWENEVIRLIFEYFSSIGINYTSGNTVSENLIDFLNVEMKLVKAIPRKVFKSDKAKGFVLPEKDLQALAFIEDKIKNGIDIRYHLGRGTLDPTYKDGLLNDWLIYHIHISNTISKPNDNFYDRADYLLFAMFNKTQVFFIDIRKHKGEDYLFAKKELLEIVKRNWPAILEPFKSKSIKKLSKDYSKEDISILRKKGYTIGFVDIDGELYGSPGGGIATSGTPNTPNSYYKKKGWVSWHDWLGFEYMPFKEARTYMRKLGLKNRDEYWAWRRSGKVPKTIPGTPEKIYKHTGWKDLGDWLGTGNTGQQKKKRMSYEQAKKYVQAVGIKTQHEFFAWRKSGQRPDTIPPDPYRAYIEFKGWGEFLGTGSIVNQRKIYRCYEDAKTFLKPLKITSQKHYRQLLEMDVIPKDIPRNPHAYYSRRNTWISFPDFFGSDSKKRSVTAIKK